MGGIVVGDLTGEGFREVEAIDDII